MIIKVCGMRDPDNIRNVSALDIDWLGLIFYEKSPRCIGNQGVEMNDFSTKKKVGVFVDDSFERIIETVDQYQLDYVQLHGNESPEFCYSLQKRGIRIIKAFSVSSQADILSTAAYEGRVEFFLFDTKCDTHGGSGRSFDWSVLAEYKGETPFLLSGGIRPESIDALNHFQHSRWIGVDLNSGFEIEPGLKDAKALNAFLKLITNR